MRVSSMVQAYEEKRNAGETRNKDHEERRNEAEDKRRENIENIKLKTEAITDKIQRLQDAMNMWRQRAQLAESKLRGYKETEL